jgi:Sulfotransferase domain
MSGDYITIVSGLPRSGTSLMMQMLQAGGMSLLTDGIRVPDVHNPRGYFEYEAVKHSRTDLSWLDEAGGKAVKVIHLLLPLLPSNRNYRVIFILRKLEEVIRSQRLMLSQQGRVPAALDDKALADVFEKQLASVRQWLAGQSNFRVCYQDYSLVIARPAMAAEEINRFLDRNLHTSEMAAVVTPALHRQRTP